MRQVLLVVADTVLTLAQQNLAFRGHRNEALREDADDSDDDEYKNRGNFLALLGLQARNGCDIMASHLEKPKFRNATHCSKATQNEMIELGKVRIYYSPRIQ